VFQVVGVQGEYIEIAYGTNHFRVLPRLFKSVPAPQHYIDEKIRVTIPQKPIRNATIVGIIWHTKRETHFYTLEFDGRTSSRQYWEQEIL
jgi:hypothetical protein